MAHVRWDGVRWDGMEYFDPQRRSGVVYAFRGSVAAEGEHTFSLQGLQPKARYRVRFHDHSSPDATVSGSQLMQTGLRVRLSESNSSEIIFLEEVSGENHASMPAGISTANQGPA